MTMLRIRKQTETRFQFPENVVRIVRPTIYTAMHAVKHHFANRHNAIDGALYRQAARNWANEVRRIDANSAYSTALAQTLGKL
jgi:hypothetical protein